MTKETDESSHLHAARRAIDALARYEDGNAEIGNAVRDAFKSAFSEEISVYVVLAGSAVLVAETALTEPRNLNDAQSRRLGLLGQGILSLGSTYDAISTGFYGDAFGGLRRLYEHLVFVAAWRVAPDEMRERERKHRDGDRQAYSIGTVQRIAEMHGRWTGTYGDLSRLTHPEGLLDQLQQQELDQGLSALSLRPVFKPNVAHAFLQTLIPLLLRLFIELASLAEEFGVADELDDLKDAVSRAAKRAEELGLLTVVDRTAAVR